MRVFLFIGLVLGALWFAAPAQAHRVNIFAYVDGNDIVVECGFSRSQSVRQGQIAVFDAATGHMLLQGTTDEKGQFRFAVPAAARQAGHDLRIQIKAGEGHQNEWIIAAAELAEARASASAAPPEKTAATGETPPVARMPAPAQASPAPASPAPTALDPAAIAGGTAAGISAAEVERIINTALDAKLAPIRRQLAEQTEAGPGLREIIGGIGWIFGIVGVAAYFRRSSR